MIAPIPAILALSLAVPAWAGRFPGGASEALGALYDASSSQREARRPPSPGGSDPRGLVRRWNQVAIDASGLDHTPVAAGETRVFGEQLGPGRSSRAMAIVHIAIFDAVNAVAGRYRGYTGLPRASAGTSIDAAIAQAAHDTLVALFPSQRASFDEALADDLGRVREGRARKDGIDLGRRAAVAILERRANDGAQHAEPRVGVDFITSDEAGKWRQDPISQIPLALGAHWDSVKPFVLPSAARFRVPPSPPWTARSTRRHSTR